MKIKKKLTILLLVLLVLLLVYIYIISTTNIYQVRDWGYNVFIAPILYLLFLLISQKKNNTSFLPINIGIIIVYLADRNTIDPIFLYKGLSIIIGFGISFLIYYILIKRNKI